jgi:hypothetical protein
MIVYTWDYHSSMSIWTGLRVQPILADEVQTYKALITVHKVLQEGHPCVGSRVTYAAPVLMASVDNKRGSRPNGLVGNLCSDGRE